MSASDVLRQFGIGALLRLLVVLLVFVALHLTRAPLVLLARLLEIGMRQVDRVLVAGLTPRPR